MIMWLLGSNRNKHNNNHQEGTLNNNSIHSTKSSQSTSSKRTPFRRNKHHTKDNKLNSSIVSLNSSSVATVNQSPLTTPKNNKKLIIESSTSPSSMRMSETYSGIEVSFTTDEHNTSAISSSSNHQHHNNTTTTVKKSNNRFNNLRTPPSPEKLLSALHTPSPNSSSKRTIMHNHNHNNHSHIKNNSNNKKNVTISNNTTTTTTTNNTNTNNGVNVVSLRNTVAEAQRIHYKEFDINNSNINTSSSAPNSPAKSITSDESSKRQRTNDITTATTSAIANNNNNNNNNNILLPSRCNDHRIPLFQKKSNIKKQLLYDDILLLLRSEPIVDEYTLVQDELTQTDVELQALEEDRIELEQRIKNKKNKSYKNGVTTDFNANNNNRLSSPKNNNNNNNKYCWNVHRKLLISKKNNNSNDNIVKSTQRFIYQQERGLCFTIKLSNPKLIDSIQSKCGMKQSSSSLLLTSPRSNRKIANTTTNPIITTISPDNCREGGAGTTIQHITLLDKNAFLLSRDNGKSYVTANHALPMYKRMKNANMNNTDIVYLSIGPSSTSSNATNNISTSSDIHQQQCYYVEFRSGACWWSVPDELESILVNTDVYRVIFGEYTNIGILSWIVISSNGQVTWKNIPIRLQNILLKSTSPPIDISLGASSSYFIRFLDGTIDYQLSAQCATICEQLIKDGREITSMVLNPDMPSDFIIRHR